jgi:uncharacterized protein involved in cysteine biosynthesis
VIPWVIGLAAVVGGVSFLLSYDGGLVQSLLFTVTPADAWWWQVLYQLSKVVLYLGLLVLTLLGSLLLMNIVASPIYETISTAVERDLIGPHATSLGLGGTLRVIVSEAVKVSFIFIVSTILLLIPGLNVIGTLVAAFLVGWDFYDYPLARRGWTFGRRFRFVLREFWAVLGFGLCLVIPGIQIILLPLAVAGGTILNVEALRERRLLGLSDEREIR